jgi:arylsulfatase A-like enzyme
METTSTAGHPAPTLTEPEAPSALATPRSRPAVVLMSWSLALWLLLIPIRGFVTGYGLHWVRSPFQHGWSVLAGAYLDFVYVAGLCVAFGVVLRLIQRPVLHRILHGLYIVVMVLSLVWAMVNIEIVKLLGQPLSYSWLYYSGFLQGFDAQQAIAASLSWTVPMVGASFILLLVVLMVVLRRCFTAALARPRLGRYLVVGGIAMAGCYLPLAAWSMRSFARPLLQNPVVALAASFIPSGQPGIFSLVSDVGDADYQVVAERKGPSTSTFMPVGPRVQNVLVIVLESVGAQYLPAYGSDYGVTPELDRYRDHTRVFQRIYAHAPNTNKSMVSLLCSTYPWPTYRFETKEHPKAGFTSLSDVLKAKGYRTGLLYSADLRFGDAEGFLVNHQFDVLKDYRSIGEGEAVFEGSWKAESLNGAKDSSVADVLLAWLRPEGDKPFFAVMWTGQTHYPYFVSGPDTAFKGADPWQCHYLTAMRETDGAIGRILRTLEDRNLLDSTLVVVVGDHGEAFGQHKQIGHACRIYEENIHIPLLLINPRLFKGEQDPVIGGMADIAPTILDVLGLDAPGNWQGKSLFGSERSPRTYFLAPSAGASFGYREGDRKYIFDAIDDRYEVFDLSKDPEELTNLAPTLSQEELGLVRKRLAGWVQYQEQFMTKLAETPLPVSRRPAAAKP